MSDKNIHLNWGACSDWYAVRANLTFLKVRLYANFADTKGDASRLQQRLKRLGYIVTLEPYSFGKLLRISDAPTQRKPDH